LLAASLTEILSLVSHNEFDHDYEKLFDIEKKWSMGDKWCYLINL